MDLATKQQHSSPTSASKQPLEESAIDLVVPRASDAPDSLNDSQIASESSTKGGMKKRSMTDDMKTLSSSEADNVQATLQKVRAA